MDNDQGEVDHSEYEYDSPNWNTLDEIYMSDDESFEAPEPIRTAGSVVSYIQKTYYLRYEHDLVKHEGASSDLQVTEYETYSGAKIEEEDPPKLAPL